MDRLKASHSICRASIATRGKNQNTWHNNILPKSLNACICKYVGPPYYRGEMYAGHAPWFPLVSHCEHADEQTYRLTDGRQTITLRFPLQTQSV